jgi:hypothetical protein
MFNFLNDGLIKDCCMLLKIVKATPWCAKRVPSHNYTGDPDSLVVNTPGSRLLDVFGTSMKTGLQKNFLVANRPGSPDSPG